MYVQVCYDSLLVANDSRPRYTGRPDYLGLRQDEGTAQVEDGNGEERFRSETEVHGTKSDVAKTAVHLWMTLIMRQILLTGSIR